MINATKETHHLLTRIPTFAAHFEHSNDCPSRECFENLGHILSLCHHFLASAHDKEASNDYEARKRWDSLVFVCAI